MNVGIFSPTLAKSFAICTVRDESVQPDSKVIKVVRTQEIIRYIIAGNHNQVLVVPFFEVYHHVDPAVGGIGV